VCWSRYLIEQRELAAEFIHRGARPGATSSRNVTLSAEHPPLHYRSGMTGADWSTEAIDIMGGDVVAGFAATTRWGSVSLAPVCPLGMVDEQARTIRTSVPLAFSDKLRRLAEAPQAALAFFRREHGLSAQPGFVLAQGQVTFPDTVPDDHLDELRERAPAYLGPFQVGRLLRSLGGAAYYEQRLPVTLHVQRLRVWDDESAAGRSSVSGDELPDASPAPQQPPKQGTDALVPTSKYAKQLRRSNDHLIGFVDSDGLPTVLPIEPTVDGDSVRFERSDLPSGGRRAALMGYWYNRRLHGQGALMARGWLDVTDGVATFAASSRQQFNTPPGSFVQTKALPVGLGFMYRKAVRSGAVLDGTFVRPAQPDGDAASS
jgi:hypothetical protein